MRSAETFGEFDGTGGMTRPDKWRYASMAELAAPRSHSLVIGPFGSDLKTSDYTDAGAPVVFVRNVRPGWYDPEDGRCVSLEKATQLRAHRVEAGDVVITKMGLPPCVAAEYPSDQPPGIVTADIIKMTPDLEKAFPRFIVHCLNAPVAQRQVAMFTSGQTRPKVTLGDFKAMRIPLPPLPEQKRIAAILDKADAIRRKRQQAIQLTESLLRSAFLEMFGDPVSNPKGWEVKKLGAAIAETQYGTAAKANSERIGLPVLRMNNITYSGGWDLRSLKWCEIQERDLDKYTTRRDDLLFNRTNSPELVGKTAVWDSDDVYAIAGYLVRVRFNDLAEPHYVSALLNSTFGKRLLFAKAKASNNMSNFSASELCRLEVPLPPRIEQDRFAALGRRTNQSLPTRVTALQRAEDLGTTLTQRAFSGGL